MKTILYLNLYCMILVTPTAVYAFECQRGKVEIGDSKYEVTQKCDEPTYKDNTQISRIRETQGAVEQVYVAVEQWLYNLGPNRFAVVVTFENSHVTAMQSYGYGKSKGEGPELNRQVKIGDPKVLVLFLFGPPTNKEERVETAVVSYKNGATVPKTTFIEEWTYNLGHNRLLRIYHFKDGRLVNIVQGDRGF